MSETSHALFLRHRARRGKRAALIRVWDEHMPAAIEAHDGHEAYLMCASHADPDVLVVYQQYRDAAAAQAFLANPAYLAYLEAARRLLKGVPEVEAVDPLWSKAVGPSR
ncbi:MAG TPA: antibiotic biosynthesis monooxygenase [Actinomycetales bacterium]|uniref:putative quinol monooxygenase n=1 Tax=Dietzia sp. 179-F 9C3 NHS TaxID=3374295 RepID=UPI001765F9DF|nr:antibiotic biosynthesis monooxygenase [Actinomycetales bacterium]